ncbi:hypothetical protein B0H19DRAFT_1264927 [Mycena capillaripes]|nr:hypothetical protein B0H19DRAFT_1264927 [Mycena capillaripes]
MSDPFELQKRVFVACTNCRERKVKCMARPKQQPCMRCVQHGLVCEYVSTKKQRAHGSKRKTRRLSNPGTPTSSTSLFPQPPSNQAPEFSGYEQTSSYEGYMPMAGNPYGEDHNLDNSSRYDSPSQPNNTYPSTLEYEVPAQTPNPTMPHPSSMQPHGDPPPQQPANPNYPLNYEYNASSQSYCTCPPNGPCYCDLRLDQYAV